MLNHKKSDGIPEKLPLLLHTVQFSSVQFSHSIISNSLRPHALQHARPPCPSPTTGTYSNSCPLSQWCHPTLSSSVVPFSSHLQSFPALGSFQMSQLFASSGQSFLEFPCFFCDPANAGNLISGSSAFSKSSWNIWKFSVHILLKPGLNNFWALLS